MPKSSGPLRLETFKCTIRPANVPLPENRVLLINDDREPRLELVDGKRQVVLQTAALSDFTEAKHAGIYHISARIDPQGMMHAVFSLYSFGLGKSYEWTQGGLPKNLPYVLYHWASVALTPDSKHLLVQHNLSASGAICEDDAYCPRIPRRGTIVDLREVSTGRVLWEIKGMASDIARGYDPVVSPDGRYAIITIPSTDGRMMNSRGTLALVSVVDGNIIQHLNGCPCDMTVDFTPDGKALNVRTPSSVSTYKFHY